MRPTSTFCHYSTYDVLQATVRLAEAAKIEHKLNMLNREYKLSERALCASI